MNSSGKSGGGAGSMAFDCVACRGLGWLRKKGHVDGRDWPLECALCAGSGIVRTCTLARALDVDRRDIWRVWTMRAGAVVGDRVLSAIATRFPALLTDGGDHAP